MKIFFYFLFYFHDFLCSIHLIKKMFKITLFLKTITARYCAISEVQYLAQDCVRPCDPNGSIHPNYS